MLKSISSRGIIDPFTILGVLFLIITAGIGTYVVTNRSINLDLNERASSCSNSCLQSDFPELCGCTSYNIDNAPTGINGGISVEDEIEEYEEEQQQNNTSSVVIVTTPPIVGCNVNGTNYQSGAIVVGGSSSSGYSRCEGNAWVPCPTCTITQLTTVPAYLQEQYNQAIQNILVEQEIAEQTAPRPNDLAIQLSDHQQEQKDICLLDGGMWSNQSMNCTYTTPQLLQEQVQTIQNSRPKGEARCSGSMLETWNGTRWDQEYCSAGCNQNKCNQVAVQNQNESDIFNGNLGAGTTNNSANTCPNGSAWVKNRCVEQQTFDISNTTASLSNLLDLYGQKFDNAITNTGLENFGQYGLGNSTVQITPPMSVLTSNNSNDFYEFYKGVGYSIGAGAATAGVVVAGAAAPTIIQSIFTNPVVQKILPYYSTLEVADTVLSSVQCGMSGDAAGPSCNAAVASLIAPPGAGFADDLSDIAVNLPTATQLQKMYGDDIIQQLKATMRQNYSFPEVIAVKPSEAISAYKAFNASGAFDNLDLVYPTQGKNSNTAFFVYEGKEYVVKTESENAIWSGRATFQEISQAGYDNTMLAMGVDNLAVTRPYFFNLPDGSVASISTKINGAVLSEPDIDVINTIQSGLINSNRFLADPGGNIIRNEYGQNVIIDYEGVFKFENKDELFRLANPEVTSLLDALGSTNTSDVDFFAEFKDR